MHILIVANGWLSQPISLPPYDLIIAADGGARHCLDNQLKPNFVIGDLDSLDEPALAELEAAGAQIIRYPTRKDFTDLELALQHAINLGAVEVTLLAALGERWDQTCANILLCAAQTAFKVKILDGKQELHFVHGGETLEIHAAVGKTVSLISLSETTQGITTENLEYPLHNEDLAFGSTRGVSNVLSQSPAIIQVARGLLLCTVNHSRE